MKHTKGPWEVGYASREKIETSTLAVWQKDVLNSGFGSVICKVSPEITMNEEDKANAQLIAAAPELLEALGISKETIEHFVQVTGQNFDSTLRVINNTIAKATGKREKLI